MGGKRTSRRNTSGKQIPSRFSSADSAKSSVIESPVRRAYAEKYFMANEEESIEMHHRKDSFDIISLLEGHDEEPVTPRGLRNGDSGHGAPQKIRDASGMPSFWHFVQPPESTVSESLQSGPMRQHHRNEMNNQNTQWKNQKPTGKQITATTTSQFPGGSKVVNASKRLTKRRKSKKVRSAKVSGLQTLERSPERLRKEGVEWLRVLTPPGTDASSLCDADNDEDEDDELIKRYFSGLSSAGSSISWAEDAMESEFTKQLMKLWDDIEEVCRGAKRPEKMSDAVHQECMQWRRAFPNPDLHRFSRNESVDVSPVETPTLDDEIERGDGDAPFSSLVHSSRYDGERKRCFEDSMNLLQANFRSLNCATPRPNIEKSTEYVNAWLSECQSSQSEGEQKISHYNNSIPSTPPQSLRKSSNNFSEETERGCRSRYSFRTVSDVARTSCAPYSRSHANFVTEPDPENFFTSLAITSNENYVSLHGKPDALANSRNMLANKGFGYNNYHQGRINESDEEGEDGRSSPSSLTEIVSFRPNMRVQRPISSRIRDHTITPLATGTYAHSSSVGGTRNHSKTQNRQPTSTSQSRSNSVSNPRGTVENYTGGRMGMFDTANASKCTSPEMRTNVGRIQSGLAKLGNSLSYYGRPRQQQAPWSRHTGEDLAVETNYVSSLYENYQNGSVGIGNGTDAMSMGSRRSLRTVQPNELMRSSGSAKDRIIYYNRTSVVDGPNSIPECEDQPFKPVVSWLRKPVSPP